MLDARILEFNYKFLQSLENRRKLTTSQIRLISITRGDPKINRGIGKTYTNQYSTLNSIESSNPVLGLSKSEKSCQFGDYSVIENVYIKNNVLPFPNSFHIYNISGVISVVENVQLNEYNDSFYLSEIKRFKSTLVQIFTDYIKSWNIFKKFIDECYVEYCYVDPDYDCGDDESNIISSFNYPDLSIYAGPDFGSRFAISLGKFPYLTSGATHTPAPGTLLKWTSSDPDIKILDDTVLNPTLILNKPLVDYTPGLHKSIFTLTATYTWGPVLVDLKGGLFFYSIYKDEIIPKKP
jgi:hypothetical protein